MYKIVFTYINVYTFLLSIISSSRLFSKYNLHCFFTTFFFFLYLNIHFVFFIFARAYGNAEQDDLWNALTQQAHVDKALGDNVTVKQIMDTWTLQTGFPVVTVVRDYNSDIAIITQVRDFPFYQIKKKIVCSFSKTSRCRDFDEQIFSF